MRILFCNKYNYAFSGTEAYLFGAMELMRSKGHEAALFRWLTHEANPRLTTTISCRTLILRGSADGFMGRGWRRTRFIRARHGAAFGR